MKMKNSKRVFAVVLALAVMTAADANGDGKVDTADIRYTLEKSVGLA